MLSSTTSSSSTSPSSQRERLNETCLTPTRKVKALLAQFDDSDSEPSSSAKILRSVRNGAPKHVEPSRTSFSNVKEHSGSQTLSNPEGPGSDNEALPQGPHGRLAAGMQVASIYDHSEPSKEDSNARTEIQNAPMSKGGLTDMEAINDGSSDDELQRPAPRRRLRRTNSAFVGNPSSRRETRSPSPLFFPSPSTTASPGETPLKRMLQHESDDEELPEDPLKQGGSRFLALVEKHRKQRLAREAENEAKRAERLAQLKRAGSRSSIAVAAPLDGLSDDSGISDGDIGNRLTQQARPTRKASKKALEEMNRETQRMSRSMQLAHQAKTKKKITKESLLARFNFSAPGPNTSQPAESSHSSSTTCSAPGSDVEGGREQETPSTSPLQLEKSKQPAGEVHTMADASGALVEDQHLSTIEDLFTSGLPAMTKGKGNATAADETIQSLGPLITTLSKPQPRPLRVRWSKDDAVIARGGDSDSDLEIITSDARSKALAVFENLPRRRSGVTGSHLILRSLAQLQASAADDKRRSINAAQMEAHLKRNARMQAQREREEKLEELRSKGVLIQTAEERQKERQEVEDLVEQARAEGAEIQRREKEIAKKDGTLVKDQFDDDESEDEGEEDFQDENDEIEDPVSGSEEEFEVDSELDQEDKSKRESDLEMENAFVFEQEVDKVRSEGQSENVHSDSEGSKESRKENQTPRLPPRTRRVLVLSDDEDDEEDNVQQHSRLQDESVPQPLLRSARKVIPGLQMSDDLPIGLTQAFAATMADSENSEEEAGGQEEDSLVLTRDLPSPQFNAVPSLNRLESLDIVTDSQPNIQTQPLDLDLSITQSQAIPQSPAGVSSTQFSFMPTQDVGYIMSPFKENRFDTPTPGPQRTVDTVIPVEEEQTPSIPRRGRLRRGRATVAPLDEVVDRGNNLTGLELDKSAFAVMHRAAKSVGQQGTFDKSKSEAREAVDEAAEESEDEYAGLGGASDDDEGEEGEADRRIIDNDETLGQGDESKLAGFYADKERKEDEAAVSKLLRDITTGALRRKRGAADDIDLSDEEDATARRREAKRREFARMRRELIKDEAVGKIAEDKRKQAFLKSIEDRDLFEDGDIGFDVDEKTEDTQSQPQAGGEVATRSETPTADNQRQYKRPLEPSAVDVTNRPSPALRRTGDKAGPVHRKPSTLAQIREHVSFLIDEPESQNVTPAPDSTDDEDQDPEVYVNLDRHLHQAGEEEEEEEGKHDADADADADAGLAKYIVDDQRPVFSKPQFSATRAPAPERRTKANVIDRLSLLRQASSSLSSSSAAAAAAATGSSTQAGSKLAFFSKSSHNPSSFFKAPSLLRRATTNSSSIHSGAGTAVRATGVTERGAVDQEKETIRKAQGGKRSAINYYAKGRVEQREKVRQGRVAKTGGAKKAARKGEGGFLGGLFGQDSWE